jgi:molecular chaperone GrpE
MSENAEETQKNEQNPQVEADVNAETVEDVAEQFIKEQQKELTADDYKVVIEDLNDKVLRAMAEAQNTRRRADIDIQNAKNFGIQSFSKDLLGVLDNLFRASETISDEDAAGDAKLKSIKEGIEITKREMVKVFERSGIKRIDPAGEVFDPNLHQAMSQVVDINVAPGTVIQVLQSGYILKDRLLRPALVVVSKAAE